MEIAARHISVWCKFMLMLIPLLVDSVIGSLSLVAGEGRGPPTEVMELATEDLLECLGPDKLGRCRPS